LAVRALPCQYSGRKTLCYQAAKADTREYYAELLSEYGDVLGSKQVAALTGYGMQTVSRWCHTGVLQGFICKGRNMVPKIFLPEFLCSPYFYVIVRKSRWHLQTLEQIVRIFEHREKGGRR